MVSLAAVPLSNKALLCHVIGKAAGWLLVPGPPHRLPSLISEQYLQRSSSRSDVILLDIYATWCLARLDTQDG